MDDFTHGAAQLRQIVIELDALAHAGLPELDEALAALDCIEEAKRFLTDLHRYIQDVLGAEMGTKRKTVLGVATFERHARREGSVKCMDEEGLWRAVLDTRIVDPETGEVTPQSEVIRMVYGSLSKETGKIRLTGASPTKVELIGLDAEMFFDKPDVIGYTIQVQK